MKKTNRLPFTDENIELEAYSDECDRLAEAEISNEYTSWGRWFLNDGNVCTYVVTPQEKHNPVKSCYVYDFSIDKCLTPESQVGILTQIAELPFIGAQGIRDLSKAFKYLARKNKNVE